MENGVLDTIHHSPLTYSPLTNREVAEILSQALGKKVRYDSAPEPYAQSGTRGPGINKGIPMNSLIRGGTGAVPDRLHEERVEMTGTADGPTRVASDRGARRKTWAMYEPAD